jgi:uncharacterized protein (TIGR02677 family)
VSDVPSAEGRDEPAPATDDGRSLFAYVTAREWTDYRAILAVFAGTFFSEFTPDEVAARLAEAGTELDPTVVADRLEQLRRWENLVVSSSVGSPSSLADYYRRRNRYLISRAGQEVHDLVEGVLGRVDEVRDVSTGRLRALLEALSALVEVDEAVIDPIRLADLVRAVFDPHEAFTSEITQFFAALNQWQSRYDLDPGEFDFFARVLVSYVADRLDEIERTARPIAHLLRDLAGRVPTIVARAERGLARRVEEEGLEHTVSVTRMPGTAEEDWAHLRSWFIPHGIRPARLTQLRADAIAAVRTLAMNLARLSRVGMGESSRRGDLVRLAAVFDQADPVDLPGLAQAAFGLGASVHYGLVAPDSDDPLPSGTPWREAPPATVPVSLRERGDRSNRGASTPLRDHSLAQRHLREKREAQREAGRRVDEELAGIDLDGATVSVAALHRLQSLVGAALARLGPSASEGAHRDGDLECTVRRVPGATVSVGTEEGTLRLLDVEVAIDFGDAPTMVAR